jgi:hypothetical protein
MDGLACVYARIHAASMSSSAYKYGAGTASTSAKRPRRLDIRDVLSRLVLIDSGTGDRGVEPGFYSQLFLGDAYTLAGFPQTTADNRNASHLCPTAEGLGGIV